MKIVLHGDEREIDLLDIAGYAERSVAVEINRLWHLRVLEDLKQFPAVLDADPNRKSSSMPTSAPRRKPRSQWNLAATACW